MFPLLLEAYVHDRDSGHWKIWGKDEPQVPRGYVSRFPFLPARPSLLDPITVMSHLI